MTIMEKKKRKKIKLKKSVIIVGIIIIAFILLLGPIKLKFKGYSLISSFKINSYGLRSDVLDHNYSIVLDEIINTKYFDKKFLKDYFEIVYYERDDFYKNISEFLNNGYDAKSINKIDKINDTKINQVASNKYSENLINYLDYDYFKPQLFDRYEAYYNGDYEDTLIKVNIGLDKEYYKDPNLVTKYSSTMIVNKYNKLSENYIPPNLIELNKCSDGGEYLTEEAKKEFDKMCDAAKADGMKLGTTSAYRSYNDQVNTYNYYLKNNGEDYAKKFVALPGFSEHQTGLAIDIKSTVASPFKTTKEYQWMLKNAYKYGFILRYPEGKENITGFNGETWHFRYVGVSVSTYIHENGITYDEYFAIFM